jgi:lipooligosaccharide transport system permease protein
LSRGATSARTGVAARIVPVGLVLPTRARYLVERNALVYRRIWLIIFSGFFEPLFYLFAIGIGVGRLVGELGEGVDYAAFVAPGLLAASAMNGAVYESTMNIFGKLKWGKVYDAILATPVDTLDVAVGEIAWSQVRGLLYATAFLVVMTLMGLVASPLAVLVIPAAMLIGFAFGAVGMAATTYMRSWQDFEKVQLVVLPLFLFSAVFFPASVYPEPVRPLLVLSPLYHGVELVRALVLGTPGLATLGHTLFLAVMGVAGALVAARRFDGLLRT